MPDVMPDVMEVTAQMRRAGGFAEPGSSIGFGFVEFGIALVAVSLEDASCSPEMIVNMVFLPVRGEVIDRARRCCPRPRALIADMELAPA